jgi:dTDP-glucose 4,6-dehydratase
VKLACKNYNVDLIGGDTTTSQKGFIISITAIGEVDENKLAYRNTAKEGDLLFVTGDLGAAFLGLQILEREKPEVIINFAAQGEGAVSWKHSWRFFETNSVALTKLCEDLSKKKWLKRFIHIGTSEMYGSVDKPSKESDPIQPSSPYAASKVAFDLYLLSISKFLNFPMNIIRPSNAYCSGQLLHRIIPKTIVSALIGKKIPLHGGGKAEKSYIHARDLGRAIYLVSEKAPLGKIYNAGPKMPTSIKSVVELCANALGKNFDEICNMAPDRLGQDSKYWLDSSSIFQDTGWKQEIFWEEGLKEVIEWAKKNINYLKNYSTDYILRG